MKVKISKLIAVQITIANVVFFRLISFIYFELNKKRPFEIIQNSHYFVLTFVQ